MIRIKCGTCGTSQGYKTQADGELTLPVAEERRLVARGVAAYVTKPIIGTDSGVATLGEGGDGGGQGDTPPEHAPAATEPESGQIEDSGNGENTDMSQMEGFDIPDVLDIVDGHFTKESLLLMQRPELDKLAAALGIDTRKCKNKGDVADLLVKVEVQPIDDGEIPPELGAGAPLT